MAPYHPEGQPGPNDAGRACAFPGPAAPGRRSAGRRWPGRVGRDRPPPVPASLPDERLLPPLTPQGSSRPADRRRAATTPPLPDGPAPPAGTRARRWPSPTAGAPLLPASPDAPAGGHAGSGSAAHSLAGCTPFPPDRLPPDRAPAGTLPTAAGSPWPDPRARLALSPSSGPGADVCCDARGRAPPPPQRTRAGRSVGPGSLCTANASSAAQTPARRAQGTSRPDRKLHVIQDQQPARVGAQPAQHRLDDPARLLLVRHKPRQELSEGQQVRAQGFLGLSSQPEHRWILPTKAIGVLQRALCFPHAPQATDRQGQASRRTARSQLLMHLREESLSAHKERVAPQRDLPELTEGGLWLLHRFLLGPLLCRRFGSRIAPSARGQIQGLRTHLKEGRQLLTKVRTWLG